jgi:hypothetical protein
MWLALDHSAPCEYWVEPRDPRIVSSPLKTRSSQPSFATRTLQQNAPPARIRSNNPLTKLIAAHYHGFRVPRETLPKPFSRREENRPQRFTARISTGLDIGDRK